MLRAAKEVKMGQRGRLLRQRNNGTWVPAWINLTLDTLYVYNDEAVRS